MRELSEAEAGLLVPLVVIGFVILFFSLIFAYERWQSRRSQAKQVTHDEDVTPPAK